MEKKMTPSMTVTIQLSDGERKVTKKNIVKIMMLDMD
jgi:phosphotransferase system HPr-like phosphotransfer protein